MSENERLPDYERPPVAAIVAAVQFRPLPQFTMAEAVAVAREFDTWRVVDVPAALAPIVEPQPGEPHHETLTLGIGSPPIRLLLEEEDGRWIFQLQQDRLAIHEQRREERPSFGDVRRKLKEAADKISPALGRPLLAQDHAPEVVEVTYDNHIAATDGGWSSFAQLNRVLRIVGETAGDPPYDTVEQITLGFSEVLTWGGDFAGRLRVQAEPAQAGDEGPILRLRLLSRRFVQGRELESVLEQCHTDIVQGFTAVTTKEMHEIWGRFQ